MNTTSSPVGKTMQQVRNGVDKMRQKVLLILLNLVFSTQAAYAAPLILMAGNVAAARDRELWENDYAIKQKVYEKIEDLERQIKRLAEAAGRGESGTLETDGRAQQTPGSLTLV